MWECRRILKEEVSSLGQFQLLEWGMGNARVIGQRCEWAPPSSFAALGGEARCSLFRQEQLSPASPLPVQ